MIGFLGTGGVGILCPFVESGGEATVVCEVFLAKLLSAGVYSLLFSALG